MPYNQFHPAFYASRRQLWATLTSDKTTKFNKFIQNLGIGSNCTSLANVWYVIYIITSTIWLLINAIWRYKEFKIQAYDPRFGLQWDDINTLHLQLAAIITGLCLFPILLFSSLSRIGHSANDSISLGRDSLHLQNLLFSFPSLQKFICTDFYGNGNSETSVQQINSNSQTQQSQQQHHPPQPQLQQQQQQQNSNRTRLLQEDELDSFILKRRGEDCCEQLKNHFRPYSTIIYVLITYIFLLPVCILEAEQIRNEVINPSYVFHSNLDKLFGHSAISKYVEFFTQHSHKQTNDPSGNKIQLNYENERPFPSHKYPLTPHETSTEFVCFIIALSMLTVQYGAPFYFTSRIFSLLFSAYTGLTTIYLLVDIETISVLYKLSTVGVRDPGGSKIIPASSTKMFFSPWHCIVLSAVGLPAVIIGLMGIYAYGEAQFKHAVTNYAQLLIAGEIPTSNGYSIKYTRTAQPNIEYEASNCPGSVGTVENLGADSERGSNAFVSLPVTLAVTTKFWRPPSSSRRNTQNLKRCNTPMNGMQPHTNGSEASGTLRRHRGLITSESGDLTNSIHTLVESKDTGKENFPKWSRVGLSVLAAVCFVWLLITRICLMGSILRCYWDTGLELALTDTILSVLYLVCWLVLWFGLSVKTAWRFRLLHTPGGIPSGNNRNSYAQKGLFTMGYDGDVFGSPGPQQLQMSINGAYPNLWPYVAYPPWITTGTGITAGLPVGLISEAQAINTMPNSGMPVGGSGGDSLYGCFAEMPQQPQIISNGLNDQYQSHAHGISLRAGPPTLSDDSDTTANATDRNDGNKYFRPVPAPSMTGSAYLNEAQRNISSYDCSRNGQDNINDRNDSSEFNVQFNGISHEPSPFEDYDHFISQNQSRVRGSKVASMQAALQRQGLNPMVSEPTYATLATLSRPTPQIERSASVTPADRLNQTSPTSFSRNIPYRRQCSRVTFKDNENNLSGSRCISNIISSSINNHNNNNDGAAGSSDSGVYTNGHNSNSNKNGSYGDKQPAIIQQQQQKGRLKPEVFAIYGGGGCKTSGIGVNKQKSISPSNFEHHIINSATPPNTTNNNNNNNINNNNNNNNNYGLGQKNHLLNDLEISTDLTNYDISKDHIKYNENQTNYLSHINKLQSNSDDRLCSQV